MLSLFRLRQAPKQPWNQLRFPTLSCPVIPPHKKIEEETYPDYVASTYYPVRIGEVFRDRYQVVGKLGYGTTSTAWLARDLSDRRHVALKVYMHSKAVGDVFEAELDIYKRMEKGSKRHPGSRVVRALLDTFNVSGPAGEHRCLVHDPLWEDLHTFVQRSAVKRLPPDLAASILHHLFLGLDFLHTECQVIHTDIKADNLMFGMKDDAVFEEFEQRQMVDPTPRKQLDGRTIYVSSQFTMPKEWGMRAPILCDFGGALPGHMKYMGDVQPRRYRAPEVMLGIPWGYGIDIWGAACMIWELFQGGSLFTGFDPEFQSYDHRAHLAEMIALLGPPPQSLLRRGNMTRRYFAGDGEFTAGISIPDLTPLEQRETTLSGQDREAFLRLMRKMLEWDPDKRATAKRLLDDEWIIKNR